MKVAHIMQDLGYPVLIADSMRRYLKWDSFMILTKERPKEGQPDVVHESVFSSVKKVYRSKADVVIIHQYFGLPQTWFFLLAFRILGVKTVIGLDLADEHFIHFNLKRPQEWGKEKAKFILMYSQMLLTDGIWCRTRNEVKLISSLGRISPKKIIVVPQGHSMEIGTSPKEKYFLGVSSWWNDRKNLHTSLSVFSRIVKRKEFSDYRFVVVGEFFKGKYRILDGERTVYTNQWETGEEYEAKVKGIIEQAGIKDKVEFIGITTGKELQELYRKAKIYYMPSKSETFGPVWLEAMASGTPVVAMKNPVSQYVIRDGVTGFLRNTEEGQEEVILALLKDEALYRKMQGHCLEEAKRFTWESVAEIWGEQLSKIVKSFKS